MVEPSGTRRSCRSTRGEPVRPTSATVPAGVQRQPERRLPPHTCRRRTGRLVHSVGRDSGTLSTHSRSHLGPVQMVAPSDVRGMERGVRGLVACGCHGVAPRAHAAACRVDPCGGPTRAAFSLGRSARSTTFTEGPSVPWRDSRPSGQPRCRGIQRRGTAKTAPALTSRKAPIVAMSVGRCVSSATSSAMSSTGSSASTSG